MLLEVEHENAPALALYERLGFTRIDTRLDYYGPGAHALVADARVQPGGFVVGRDSDRLPVAPLRGDVLVQLAAAESAVHRIAEIVLQDHMETCVVEQVRAGNVEVVDEAMRLIKKFM